jgi:hypothetical protein
MITLAQSRFTLYRVHPGGSKELVSEYSTFEEGWRAGTRAVTVLDREGAYTLYRNGVRVAKFAHNRLMPRFSSERAPLMLGVLL